jgi:hypothetical protein
MCIGWRLGGSGAQTNSLSLPEVLRAKVCVASVPVALLIVGVENKVRSRSHDVRLIKGCYSSSW